jgi:hypothetical protein
VKEHVENIGPRGARGRRKVGWIGVSLAAVGAVALIAGHAPRATRLMLVLPIGVAAAGFLQSRERT